MYPCYINYEGNVEVDFELCPNARQVDDEFKVKVKGMYDQLKLILEKLEAVGSNRGEMERTCQVSSSSSEHQL